MHIRRQLNKCLMEFLPDSSLPGCCRTAPNGSLVDRPICVEDQSEVLEKSQLEAIASSSEIRNTLNDESLQKLICAIGSSPDPETELDRAMEDEAFRIFSSKISSIIGS
ncbi:uncharacterized protein LOC111024491 isoform X2 [Momordica charantia]|uniref:Uncharacterized protein LOC111024491 isoform X2 n=1 Tax=Momordica charantia TaxID=3673 RepID=A0A6J1DVQ5_MOMCH|nr:uncharacterized protein LOC111024491 isoform X2 [Momordica charantia]